MLNELRVDLFEPIRTDLMNAREKLIKHDETKRKNFDQIKYKPSGHGGGQVVSVLAFYYNLNRSNPADAYSFSVILCLKRTKINKKRGRGWPTF